MGRTSGLPGLGCTGGRGGDPLTPVSPQAYTDELVELHRRLMALRERNVLQQVCGRVGGGWALGPAQAQGWYHAGCGHPAGSQTLRTTPPCRS